MHSGDLTGEGREANGESLPLLGYFILDVLRYDIEQMPTVLNLLNGTGSVGWREFWNRDFERGEVREMLEYLAERGLVVPYADANEPELVPLTIERARQMSDEYLWWLLDVCGKEAWDKWEGYPTS